MKQRVHAIFTVRHDTTFCGRKWRLDPKLVVETEWRLVTCKRCRVKVDEENERILRELTEALADDQPADPPPASREQAGRVAHL